ncbi:MAG: hypothetical protein RO009_17970 [Pseudorhodoplanes sp.]|jgi:hypothetical protein|nr:hypothetical protein [Pseudorhodoplanes sp.]
MPKIDSVTGILTMPWWIAAVAAACALFFCIFLVMRNGIGRSLAGIAWFGVIALALGLGWNIQERLAAGDRAAERRALDSRLAALTLQAIAPNSALACLSTSAGDAVDAACEKSLFASPEAVAAALAFAEARLDLLTAAADFAARGNDYEHAVATLRRPVEVDRFGFFAQAFAVRDNCTAENCDAAELLLQDPARILANLKDGVFQGHVGRHAVAWGQPAGPALAAAPSTPAAPVVATTADFPSADSIPPISIMNNEPGMPGQNGVDNKAPKAEPAKPAQQARRPAAKRAPEPPAPAGQPGFPIPIAPARPAAANSGAAATQ